MGVINPTLPTIGGARGDGEVALRADVNSILSEFNGNIDAANVKAASITADRLVNVLGYPLGLTGAVAATRLAGGTTSGAPVTGTFATGDVVIAQDGKLWICTAAGTPGTWVTTATPTLATLGVARGLSGSVSSGGGTLAVSHGLSGTPPSVVATPTTNNGGSWDVGSIGSSQFTIINRGSNAAAFMWIAIL